MLKRLLPYFFAFACVMAIPLAPHSPIMINVKTNKLDTQRNLDSNFPSAPMKLWFGYLAIQNNINDSDDLYLDTYLSLFISSNETILSRENCPVFNPFTCSSPDCDEDVSSTYSVSYPRFSSNNVTRISLKTQRISIAEGAWKLNSSPLYMHDCELSLRRSNEGAIGQVGLGLSGKAYQNFQTPNPIFSILIHSRESAELIFGLNPIYIRDNEPGISVSCDLDWRVPITSFTIGNSTISTDPMALIFDVRTPGISLPTAYYDRLRDYFLQVPTLVTYDDEDRVSFNCLDNTGLQSFPLVFTFENGTQLIFPQSDYWFGNIVLHSIDVRSHNSTFSGVEYIVLGVQALSKYYTAFQQHEDKSTTITLYPLSSSALSTQDHSFSLHSPELPEGVSAVDSTVELRDPDKTAPNESQLEPSNTSSAESPNTKSYYNEELEHSVFSPVICVLLIVIFCGLIFYIFRRVRAWFGTEQKIGRPKSTVELNESSHFVSNISIGVNGTNDDEIDLFA